MSIRVLLVDDEKELVETVAERLQLRGFDVSAFTDGAAAVAAGDGAFDVAVVDVKMPGFGGIAVLERLKEQSPQMPVILLTGHGSPEEGEEGMKLGAFAYLFKPVKIEELIATMSRATGERNG